MRTMTRRVVALAATALALAGSGDLLPNGGFNEGEQAPAGWSLSGGQGAWLRAEGR